MEPNKEIDKNQDTYFHLRREIRKYMSYVKRYVSSEIPSIHRDVKIHLLDENYNLYRELNSATFTIGNIRNKHVSEMIISITMIDYLLGYLLDVAKKKGHIKIAIGMLTDIKNMTFGWKKKLDNENKKDKG